MRDPLTGRVSKRRGPPSLPLCRKHEAAQDRDVRERLQEFRPRLVIHIAGRRRRPAKHSQEETASELEAAFVLGQVKEERNSDVQIFWP